MTQKKHAKSLLPSEVRHLLRVTRATSRHPERDVLILLLGLAAGMRISEIATLEVRDVLLPSGKLRSEVSLTETKGNVQRLAYLTHPKLIEAFEDYIAWRKKKRFCCALADTKYRGLMPATKLIVTWKGSKYELTEKRILNTAGEEVYYRVASSLQAYVTTLYAAAGIKGGSSHSGRRTLASNLIREGYTLETVQTLLGHKDMDVTACYIDVDKARLREMFEAVL